MGVKRHLTGVDHIYSTRSAFAAVRHNDALGYRPLFTRLKLEKRVSEQQKVFQRDEIRKEYQELISQISEWRQTADTYLQENKKAIQQVTQLEKQKKQAEDETRMLKETCQQVTEQVAKWKQLAEVYLRQKNTMEEQLSELEKQLTRSKNEITTLKETFIQGEEQAKILRSESENMREQVTV